MQKSRTACSSMAPPKSCTIEKAAEHHVNVSLGDAGLLPGEGAALILVRSNTGISCWWAARFGVNRRAGVLVAKPLPPHCGVTSAVNKLGGWAEGWTSSCFHQGTRQQYLYQILHHFQDVSQQCASYLPPYFSPFLLIKLCHTSLLNGSCVSLSSFSCHLCYHYSFQPSLFWKKKGGKKLLKESI